MNRKRILFAPALLMAAILACNTPTAQGTAPDGSAATITALAATIQAQSGAAITDTPASAALPTDTPAPALTATPSVPMVTVSQTTNCRTGPGTAYDLVSSLNVGVPAEVVGKYSAGNYLVIKSSAGNCWLWGQYATVSGNTSGLPEMIPPPSPTPVNTPTPVSLVPADPSNFKQTHACTSASALSYNVHTSLTWTDTANNEDGYYIYRNGTLLATLAANSTSYSDSSTLSKLYIVGHPKPTVEYSIRAFNSSGKSDYRQVEVGCP